MDPGEAAWTYFIRLFNAVGRRTFEWDFDRFMSAGCNIIRRGSDPLSICITFDDGPDEEVTPLILDELLKCSASATFFCVGRNAVRQPSLLRAIRAAGHEIGNHTMNHPDLHRVSTRRLRSEIEDCQSVLQDILGEPVISFRAPYGHFRWEMHDLSYFGIDHLVGWDVGPPFTTDPRAYSSYIQENAAGGSIIGLHDCMFDVEPETARKTTRAAAESLQMFIPALSQRGFSFSTVSRHLGATAMSRAIPPR